MKETRYELDVLTMRGELAESRHRVHAVVMDSAGRRIASAGDPTLVTCWRSCAKPLQLMPAVESGHLDRLGWGSEELALACASHGGEPEHVALVTQMLADIGMEAGDLACGTHDPLSRRGARMAQEAGEPITRLHNNCSGKHAAMLAYALGEGWPVRGYEQCVHPVQQRILERVSFWTGVPEDRVVCVVDGCGVVAFGLPLDAMARAFARIAHDACAGGEVTSRIFDAMRTHPFLVGGTDRFDTVLMEELEGRVISKIGAEGLHTVAIPEMGIALAVKVEDGNPRAQYPAVLRLLRELDVLPEETPARLAKFARSPIQNTRGEVVGEIRPVA